MTGNEFKRTSARRLRGFTLIEMVLVMVISGVLLTVAMRAGMAIARTSRMEETKKGMRDIEFAICGNPALRNNGTRSDFGYVGDIGGLPANLEALASNPGSYTTWNGPYIRGRFQQASTDYKQDGWGVNLQYAGGVSIASIGSGDTVVHAFANAPADLLYDKVSGTVQDRGGLPPGTSFKDSITVRLSFPNGAGATLTRSIHPDASGYFLFDSIPIGTHDLVTIYGPTHDTLKTFVTVLPSSTTYSPCQFASQLWGNGTLMVVAGSDTVSGSPPCTDVAFWIVNNTGASRTITTTKVTWASPAAFYGQFVWGGTLVFDMGGSPRGVSGTTYTFSSAQTITSGQRVKIQIKDFRSNNNNGGGSPVAMANVTLSVLLSDGTTFTEVMPSCP
jgi:prepilin-type N-terminal cleavage/methylation domain-containing protein